jgi:hypothetical protein
MNRKLIVGDQVIGGVPAPEPESAPPAIQTGTIFPYRCQHCPDAFTTPQALGSHLVMHHGAAIQSTPEDPTLWQGFGQHLSFGTSGYPIVSFIPRVADDYGNLEFPTPPTSPAVLCEHANESPAVCYCSRACVCRVGLDGPCRTARWSRPPVSPSADSAFETTATPQTGWLWQRIRQLMQQPNLDG